MTQQTLIEPQKVDLAQPGPTSSGESFEGLLGRLVETLQEQSRLRTLTGRWDELAAIQSTLHELRAALATERSRRRPS